MVPERVSLGFCVAWKPLLNVLSPQEDSHKEFHDYFSRRQKCRIFTIWVPGCSELQAYSGQGSFLGSALSGSFWGGTKVP